MLIDINTLTVTCPETNEDFTRLSKEHALSLGYSSLSKYRKTYNLRYLTAAQRTRQHFKRLYNVDFKKWVAGYDLGDGMQYGSKFYDATGKSDKPSASRFPLSDGHFNSHLRGENPLAVFAYGKGSRYFILDVDTKEAAKDDTFTIIGVLESIGINRNDIHVTFSGSKGYHIEFYVDDIVTFKDWEKLGLYVIYTAGFTPDVVEMRPNPNNSLAVKLPLTLHPKTKLFAGYCDANLDTLGVQESYDYIANIRQASAATMQQLIDRIEITRDEPKPTRKPRDKSVKVVEHRLFKTGEEKRETAVRLLSEGLPGNGTRWKALRNVLIPYLKIEMGCSPEETRDILVDFCEQEYEAGRTTTPLEKSVEEITQLISGFYPLVKGFYSVKRDVEVTRSEVDWVVSVVENKGTRTTRDLLWALLLFKKAYQSPKDDDFFVSRTDIQALLTKPRTISPISIQRSRDWLVENGYISFTVPERSYVQRKATVYQLHYDDTQETDVLDQVAFNEDMDSRELLQEITQRLYTPKELKVLKLV